MSKQTCVKQLKEAASQLRHNVQKFPKLLSTAVIAPTITDHNGYDSKSDVKSQLESQNERLHHCDASFNVIKNRLNGNNNYNHNGYDCNNSGHMASGHKFLNKSENSNNFYNNSDHMNKEHNYNYLMESDHWIRGKLIGTDSTKYNNNNNSNKGRSLEFDSENENGYARDKKRKTLLETEKCKIDKKYEKYKNKIHKTDEKLKERKERKERKSREKYERKYNEKKKKHKHESKHKNKKEKELVKEDIDNKERNKQKQKDSSKASTKERKAHEIVKHSKCNCCNCHNKITKHDRMRKHHKNNNDRESSKLLAMVPTSKTYKRDKRAKDKNEQKNRDNKKRDSRKKDNKEKDKSRRKKSKDRRDKTDRKAIKRNYKHSTLNESENDEPCPKKMRLSCHESMTKKEESKASRKKSKDKTDKKERKRNYESILNECESDEPNRKKRRLSCQSRSKYTHPDTTRASSDLSICLKKNDGQSGKEAKHDKKSMVSDDGPILSVPEMMVKIYEYFDVKELIKLRLVKYKWNELLSFKFNIMNNKIYFEYNNKFIKDIIKRDVCINVNTLAAWFVESVNIDNGATITDKEIVSDKFNNNNKENDKYKPEKIECGRRQFLFSIVDKHERKEKLGTSTRLFVPDAAANDQLSLLDSNGRCNVFKRLFTKIDKIDTEAKTNGFSIHSGIVDELLLGNLFDIKPLKRRLRQLFLKHDFFRHSVCKGRLLKFSIDGVRGYYVKSKFNCVLRKLAMSDVALVSRYRFYGFAGFFHMAALKGDFNLYDKYIYRICQTDEKRISNSGRVLDGIFSLFCLFLEQDRIDNYIHCQTKNDESVRESIAALYHLVNPDVLSEYKQLLLEFGVPLTDKQLFNFDLINNEKYHPYQRIKALRKVAFSSQFGVSLCDIAARMPPGGYDSLLYLSLREVLSELYNDFNEFQTKWRLLEIKDLKDDLDKQKELHEQFRILVHGLLAFGGCYFDYNATSTKNIITSKVKPNKDKYNIGLNGDYKFIDLNIENESQLQCLFELITQNNSLDTISEYVRHPRMDQLFEEQAQNWDHEKGDSLVFDQVSDPYSLFYQMWKIDHID